MPRIFYKFVLSGLLLSLFAQPIIEARKKDGSLQIKGSDTMVNLVQAWVEEFMAADTGSFVAVTGGGSGTGFAALINDSCDIAMTSRSIKTEEIRLAEAKGIHPKEYKVALDGLVAVVNPKNPVSRLTMDQLAGIFTGKIRNWKEVGGQDAKIVVLSREVNSGTHVYFKEHVLAGGDSKSREEFSPDALLMPSSQAIADEVAQNPAAIGYYGMGYVGKSQRVLAIAQDADSEFVSPEVENVVSGRYPISRPLFLYTNGEPQGKVKEIIDFIFSEQGQSLVSTVDFVPIR